MAHAVRVRGSNDANNMKAVRTGGGVGGFCIFLGGKMNKRFFLQLFFIIILLVITLSTETRAAPGSEIQITTRVSVASDGTQGNYWPSGNPSISADGRYVAFDSAASNLVSDDTNGGNDVFVHSKIYLENDVFLPIVQK
jgi:hypothetical protein